MCVRFGVRHAYVFVIYILLISDISVRSRYFQTSAEDIHFFCEILTTKCIKRIRDLFEYALYKFTLYLLTYLHYIKIRCHNGRLHFLT